MGKLHRVQSFPVSVPVSVSRHLFSSTLLLHTADLFDINKPSLINPFLLAKSCSLHWLTLSLEQSVGYDKCVVTCIYHGWSLLGTLFLSSRSTLFPFIPSSPIANGNYWSFPSLHSFYLFHNAFLGLTEYAAFRYGHLSPLTCT